MNTLFFFSFINEFFQTFPDADAVLWFHTSGFFHNNIGIHGDEAAISVVDKFRVPRFFNKTRNGL